MDYDHHRLSSLLDIMVSLNRNNQGDMPSMIEHEIARLARLSVSGKVEQRRLKLP